MTKTSNTTAKKSVSKTTVVKKAAVAKPATKKTAAKTTEKEKESVKKTAAKKVTVKKTSTTKAKPSAKTAVAKKTAATKAAPKKTTTTKAAGKTAATKKITPAKQVSAKTPVKKAPVKKTAKKNPALDIIVDAMHDKKAQSVVSLDFATIDTAICDYFVICNADSTPQVNAIADNVEEQMYKKMKQWPIRCQGRENGFWIIMDYGDFIVHIFQTEYRKFYRLEELWADAKTTWHNEQ